MVHDAKRIEFTLMSALQRAQASALTWSSPKAQPADTTRRALQAIDAASPVFSIFEAIRPLLPFAAGMIEVLSASHREEPAHFVYDVPEGFLSERARLIEKDPSLPMVAQSPAGCALRGPDVIPEGAFHRLDYNQMVYGRFGLDNVTGMILSKDGAGAAQEAIVLWLFSGGDIRLPTWEECRRLSLVCGDIRDAVMRARLPLAIHEPSHFQAMQDQGVGYLLLRSNGTLLEANRKAAWLSQKYSPRSAGSWRKHVHALISTAPTALQRGTPGSYRIPSSDGSGVLKLHVHRLTKLSEALREDVTMIRMEEMMWSGFQRLSQRQREIAGLLAFSGLSYKEIAGRLGIKEGSMRTHTERIYRALGVHSRFELIERAAKGGGEESGGEVSTRSGLGRRPAGSRARLVF
ncbi:MAG TPA: helix-turn-helix transcriptional regulator [Polyangiaceae bacterium]|jgi:DNA-binding NarL/FixJ family response regulator|nr:helix-turn-helix transcriptional regulator [Polyangiaceae bacterium]